MSDNTHHDEIADLGLQQQHLAKIKTSLAASKVSPGLEILYHSDPSQRAEYEEHRAYYNRASTATPLAIARPKTEDELCGIVKLCAEHSVPMTIRSGGHDLQMRPLRDGAVLVDMRRFNAVRVARDPGSSRYAVIGGGATSKMVLAALESEGLITPTGWCLDVGYVGWAAGGGYGLMASSYGIGADQILGARIVTPQGQIVDTDTDLELLWAIRGAGLGNFGVVLDVRVKVYPRPRVLAGFLVYPMTEARQVLTRFEALCVGDGDDGGDGKGIPRELAGEAATANAGHGPMLVLYFHWILDGSQRNKERGEEWLGKYRALGSKTIMDTVAETTPFEFVASVESSLLPPAPNYVESVNVPGFTPDFIDILVASPPMNQANVVIHHGHGKILDHNDSAAFSMRKERHLVVYLSSRQDPGLSEADDAETIAEIRKWPGDLNREIRGKAGLATSQSYWSFAKDEFCDVEQFYGKGGAERLRALKRRYNPRNCFQGVYPVLEV